MKLKVSLEYSDKTSCFELKLFQNEPKKLSLGNATVRQKNWPLYMHQESLQFKDFNFGHELTVVQPKMYATPLPNGWIWTPRL